jgi:tetratricopeptide (TPR) repeat protein
MADNAAEPRPIDSGQNASGKAPEREEATERRDFLKLSLAAAVTPEALRDFLHGMGAVPIGFTPHRVASVVERGTIERLEAMLADLDRCSWQQPPARTLGMARAYRAEVAELIEGPHTLKEARELYVCAGWLSEILAWLYSELGARRTAESYALDCYGLAEEAGHDELCAWAMNALASFALYDNRPEQAFAAAGKGIHKAPRQHPLAIRLRAHSARAHARLGRRRECEEVLAEATGLCERVPSTTPARFGVDTEAPQVLAGYRASAYLWLEDFEKAKVGAEEAVALHDAIPVEVRSPSRQAIARLDLGIALAGLGSPDEAVGQGRLALGSPRVVEAVLFKARCLNAALTARYPDLPEVRDFEEQYRQVARRATTV